MGGGELRRQGHKDARLGMPSPVLIVVLVCAQFVAPSDATLSVTVGSTGTDDALLTMHKNLTEGATVCASSTHCYVSSDALQSALQGSNVSISVTGAITIATAPTNGQPFTSAAVSLTLSAGAATSSLDHMLIQAPLNLGSQGTLYLINKAPGGVTCVVGASGGNFGGAPTCTDSGGSDACSRPGLFCLLSAELQRITAKAVYVSNVGTSASMTLNGLSTSDTSGIADVLSLATNVNGYSGSANQQFVIKAATSEASCSLHLSSNEGMTVDVQVSSSGGDLKMDGDVDRAASGAVVLSTPPGGAGGVPQKMLSAAGKLTLGAKTGGVKYAGAGHLKLSANAGVHITSDVVPNVNGLEIHVDADADSAGEGVLKIDPQATVGSSTQTRAIYLTAADIDFGEDMNTVGKVANSGSYQIYLYMLNGRRIGLGIDLSAEAGMSISGNEMYGFASKVVNIGGSSHGGIIVAALAETQTMNTERFVLIATSTSNGTVTFQDGTSNFRVLDVIAYKGITVAVPGTEGVKTTYFTGTLTMTVQGTEAQGAFGIVFAKGARLNSATKLTLTSASGARADTTLYLNAGSGIQIDIDLNVTSSGGDINVVFDCDTDLGGLGLFTLCGPDADVLANSVQQCTATRERRIRLVAETGSKAHLTVKSMQIALAGEIDTGSSGSVTLFPTSNVKVAFGDKPNMPYTLKQTELNRIAAGDTLTVGSSEAERLWVSGIRSNRTGATKIVASKAGAFVMLHKEYDVVAGTWSPSLYFTGALTLQGGDGVFVNDSLHVGGPFAVDANANSLGGDSFYCVNGNEKLSCSSDADCGRNLCSDGVTFCDGGQVDCTGTVCNVPSTWGSCVSKGEFRLSHNMTITTGGASIEADAVVLIPQMFPWHSSNASIGGHMHVEDGGDMVLKPKTARAVRLGQFPASVTYYRAYQVYDRYGTTFGLDQRTLDAIHALGSFTIGGDKTSSITVTGLTMTRSSGFLRLVSTVSSAGSIAFVNSSECSDLPTKCEVTVLGPLFLSTLGSCTLAVDLTVFLLTASCDGPTTQTGILRIQGAGIDLQYIAVGDVVISGDVINQDRMIFRATGHVNISSSMTCRGRMVITADSDNDGHGNFQLAAGSVLTSNNNDIDIRANTIELGDTGTAIRAGVADISIAVSDGAEIGLNAAASGMQISAIELSKLSCRNLTIGGVNSHVRIGALPPESLAGMIGYVVIRALSAGAEAHVGVDGASNLTFPALDLEVAGNMTVYKSVLTTQIFTTGPASSATIVAALRLAAHRISLSSGVQLSSAGDLYLGHYAGANGASAWGYGGSPRIGDLNVNVPSTLRSGRHLILLSHIKTSGSGLLGLIADQDGNLDGSVLLAPKVQIHAAQGVTNGTLLLAGNDVRIMQGVRVHLDRGDLLVTASDFAFAPAPECARGASLSLELVNRPENQWFLTRSTSAPGFAFFEPVPTVISSVSSYVPILDKATGKRGAGRGRFSPAGGDVITISGSAFGPSGLDSRFSVKVGDRFCSLSGGGFSRHLVPPSGVFHDTTQGGPGSEGEPVKVTNIREYNWQLLNGTLIRRFTYSFSLTCALPPGSGESLDLLFVAGWCGGVHRERSLLGYAPPRVSRILPATTPVGGPGGGGVLLTFLGSYFGVSPPNRVCSSPPTGETCEDEGHNVGSLAGYLRGTSADGSHSANLLPCSSLVWTSDSSVSCGLSSIRGMSTAKAVIIVGGQEASGGHLDVIGSAAYLAECDNAVRGLECESGDCRRDCSQCCRRSCQRQWHSDPLARQAGGGLAVASLSANAYAQCAVMCEDYCKMAVLQPRDWSEASGRTYR